MQRDVQNDFLVHFGSFCDKSKGKNQHFQINVSLLGCQEAPNTLDSFFLFQTLALKIPFLGGLLEVLER